MDVEASARKHGVPDEDMLHALRHHWRAFETDDPAVTMFIGPSRTGRPLEVGVVVDAEGLAVIHVNEGSREVPERLVERMSKTREERAEALEKWADKVDTSELKTAETQALRTLAQLVDQRNDLDEQITEAVISARQSQRSWSEIGTMLGVSKQAAQRKYSPKASNRRA